MLSLDSFCYLDLLSFTHFTARFSRVTSVQLTVELLEDENNGFHALTLRRFCSGVFLDSSGSGGSEVGAARFCP